MCKLIYFTFDSLLNFILVFDHYIWDHHSRWVTFPLVEHFSSFWNDCYFILFTWKLKLLFLFSCKVMSDSLDSMLCSPPGSSVLYPYLPEVAQIHVQVKIVNRIRYIFKIILWFLFKLHLLICIYWIWSSNNNCHNDLLPEILL